MTAWTTVSMLAFGCLVVLYLGRWTLGSRHSYQLPPGPPGLPWVGNIIGVSASTPWKTYTEWGRTYGDMLCVRFMGRDMVILNSEQIAKDLLENRSKNYSDRPHFSVTTLCGLDFNTAFLRYGGQWRLHRRFFHQTFRLGAVHRFFPMQHRKACVFLRQLFDAPEELNDHIHEYTGVIIMNSVYDYDPVSSKDKLIELVTNFLKIIVPVLRPGVTAMVDNFPWVLYLPSWFPGMSFKRKMETARGCSKLYVERLFEYALPKAMNNNVAPSMIHDALQEMKDKGILPDSQQAWIHNLKQASGTAFLAASETSGAVLMTFFLMMVVHQKAQERVQAEIDAVVGNNRLPTMDDRPSLPFLDAVFREVLRYSPIIPLSIPHTAVEDDVYEGFCIPKGAIIISNLWAMAHNESKYPNPHMFIPERFLNHDGSLKPNETEHLAYGFGRRICVGRHFADASVWSLMANVLAVFKILGPLDKNGVEIPVEPKFTGVNTVRPLPFKCRFVPRIQGMDAEKLEQLISATIS